jgi:uncharacterized protein (DUF2345 family)
MGDKFLLTKGSASSLSNGTTDVFAATLGAIGLNPSMPLKTNSFRQLVSTKLDISDINTLGSTLATLAQSTASVQPPSGTVTDNGLVVFNGTAGDAIKEETGYSIDTVNNKLIVPDISTDTSNSVNTELQKIQNFSASTINPDITTIVGELDVSKIKSYAHNCEIELDNNNMTLSADGEITLNSVGDIVKINADRTIFNNTEGIVILGKIATSPANGANGDLDVSAEGDVIIASRKAVNGAIHLNADRTILNTSAGELYLKAIRTSPQNGDNGNLTIEATTDLNLISQNSGDINLTSDGDIDINAQGEITLTPAGGTLKINAVRTDFNTTAGEIYVSSVQTSAQNGNNGDLLIAATTDLNLNSQNSGDINLTSDGDIDINAQGEITLTPAGGTLKINAVRTDFNTTAGEIYVSSVQTSAQNGNNGDLLIAATTDLNLNSQNLGDISLTSDRHVEITPNASVTGEIRLNSDRTILNAGTGDLLARSIQSVSNNGQNGDLILSAAGNCRLSGAEVRLNARFTVLDGGSGTLIADTITNAGSSGNVNVRATDTLVLGGTDITLSPFGTGQVTCNQTPTTSTSVVNKDYADSLAPKTGTKSEMLALTGMVAGQQFYMNANAGTNFTSQENKMFVWSGRTWQVTGETIEMVCDADMIEGNTLEIGMGADFQVKKTVATESDKCIGVIALQGATLGDWVTVATRGLWLVACKAGNYIRSSYLQTDTVDGLARLTNSVSGQPFAKIVETRTTILDGTGIWGLLHTQEIY